MDDFIEKTIFWNKNFSYSSFFSFTFSKLTDKIKGFPLNGFMKLFESTAIPFVSNSLSKKLSLFKISNIPLEINS